MLIKVLRGVVLVVFFNYDMCGLEDKFKMDIVFVFGVGLGVSLVVGVNLDFF